MKADDKHVAGEAVTQAAVVIWFDQIVNPPERLMIDTMNVPVSAAEIQYFSVLVELDNDDIKAESVELALVGAGIGGGFANTNELKVLNYKEAMQSPNKAAWEEEIENEFKCIEKLKVIMAVSHS